MDKYIKDFDRNPDVISNAVYILLEMKEKEKAEYYLGKLKQLSPSNPKTLLLTGLVAEQNGNLKIAQFMYESAFKVNPEELLSIQALGDILMRQNMWSRSIDHFRKALVSRPNEPYILERVSKEYQETTVCYVCKK